MKSVKDLYEEIIVSEELKQKLEEAVKEKRVEDFLREQGCDATLDELEAFLRKHGKRPESCLMLSWIRLPEAGS